MFPVGGAGGEGAAFHDDSGLGRRKRRQDTRHDTLRAFLTDQLSAAELRNALEGEPGYRPELHAELAGELGLSGWTIPEEFGGLGKSQVEACAIHIELGRVLYPGPFLPSSVAAGALLATGHREACERWLPRLAAGTVAGTVAAADEAGYWAPGPGSVRADYGTGGWRLSGRRWYVVAAHAAGILVVPAVTESGLAMFMAETGSPSLEISRQLDLDLTRRISIITFEAAPAVLLTRDAGAALARAEREFLIATAAEAAGGIGWCLDASLAYVREQGQSDHSAARSRRWSASASTCSPTWRTSRRPPGTPRPRPTSAPPTPRRRPGSPPCRPAAPTAARPKPRSQCSATSASPRSTTRSCTTVAPGRPSGCPVALRPTGTLSPPSYPRRGKAAGRGKVRRHLVHPSGSRRVQR